MARYLPAITNGEIAALLQSVAVGMAAPDYAISPPGDTNRLFVVEQNGLLRIIQSGTLLPGSALDISALISTSLNPANLNDERGFLGLAFHPGFNNPASPGFQTLYTFNSQLLGSGPTYAAPNGASQGYKTAINEWKVSTTNDNVVDPDSRREILSFGKNANNHNGGTSAFGPDGYLYLGLGDGGNANDVGASHIEPYYKDGSEILVSRGKNKNPRRLTPRECARLMGFPDDFRIPVSDTQAYRQFGDASVPSLIDGVARAMKPHVMIAISTSPRMNAHGN